MNAAMTTVTVVGLVSVAACLGWTVWIMRTRRRRSAQDTRMQVLLAALVAFTAVALVLAATGHSERALLVLTIGAVGVAGELVLGGLRGRRASTRRH